MRMIHLVVALSWLALSPIQTQAQLSPGPLADPHAHLSGLTNCLQCHTWGSKDLTPKCMECHTPIRDRIEQGLGFHGRLLEADCQTCHTDHMKREFKMIHWEPSQEEFDHGETGYELAGKHKDLKCAECHQSNLVISQDVIEYAQATPSRDVLSSTFLGLGTQCSDCHSDVHKKEFEPQVCQDCHDQNSWGDARKAYDHATRTDFPLRGAHEKIDCEKCHTNQQKETEKVKVPIFSGLKFDQCTRCHEDKHKGSFGANCLKCHTELTFKIDNLAGTIDHNATRYPLIGKHTLVKCETCHSSEGRFAQESSFDTCTDCHEDHHKDSFTKSERNISCDQCHSVRGFLPALFGVNEHKNTRFVLDGAHLAQPCVFCHLEDDKPLYRWDPLACQSCHETSHGPQFSRYQQDGNWCENCHQTSEWQQLTFDHSTTFFPLTGKHLETPCSACHKKIEGITQFEDISINCNECHGDVHAQQFQEQSCEDCHSTSVWRIPDFDHFILTEFPLDGQHEQLQCGQCHKFEAALNTIRFKPIPSKCQDCHSFGDFKN